MKKATETNAGSALLHRIRVRPTIVGLALCFVTPVLLLGIVGSRFPLVSRAGEKPGLTEHLVVGMDSDWDCTGFMKNYAPLAELGSMEIAGHRFQFELGDADSVPDRIFLLRKGLQRGPGVYVFDASGELEYNLPSLSSKRAILDHLSRVASGFTIQELSRLNSGPSLDLDTAWEFFWQSLDDRDEDRWREIEQRIRLEDPELESISGSQLRLISCFEDWWESLDGISAEDLSYEPVLSFLEGEQHPEVLFFGYSQLAYLAPRVEHNDEARVFYLKALEYCPDWRRPSLRVEAQRVGVTDPLLELER